MGNSQGGDYDPLFDPNRYVKPGITTDEILCIRKNFLSFQPNDMFLIDTQAVLNKYKDAYQMNSLRRDFGQKRQLTFDEFYTTMSNILISRKQDFQGVEFDSGVQQVQCICYPSVQVN